MFSNFFKIFIYRTTPKQLAVSNRSSSTLNRNSASGISLPIGSGLLGASIGNALAPSSSLHGVTGATMNSTTGLPNVVGATLPLTPASLSDSTSIAASTNEAAAMFAALAQQHGAGANAASTPSAVNLAAVAAAAAAASSNPFALSQQASAAAALSANPSQAQPLFPAQRLFDPNMALVLQQMQSVRFIIVSKIILILKWRVHSIFE